MNAPLKVKNDCMVFVRFEKAGKMYAYRSTKVPRENNLVVVKTPKDGYKVLAIAKVLVGRQAREFRNSCAAGVDWKWLVSLVDITEYNMTKELV
jgi:hypothetical protein